MYRAKSRKPPARSIAARIMALSSALTRRASSLGTGNAVEVGGESIGVPIV